MKANLGNIDRVLRLLAGAAAVAFGYMGGLESPWNIVAMGVGGVLILTALVKFCPAYAICGCDSCKKADAG